MEKSESFIYDNQDESLKSDISEEPGKAISLKLTLGFSANKIGAIHNLTFEEKGEAPIREIFFPAAHTGVIYNYETGEQKLLQGHCNDITACCAIYDPEKRSRWIVTADSGKNSMIVIWNADTGMPHSKIFKLPSDKIVSIDISKDCQHIATLSNKYKESEDESDMFSGDIISQKISIWEWRNKTEQIFVADFFDHDEDIFHLLRFNPNSKDPELEILVQGPSKILFWNVNTMKPENCRPYFPIKSKGDRRVAKTDKEKKKNDEEKREHMMSKNPNAVYTQSTFLNGHTMAITATTSGNVIVWDMCPALCKEDELITDRRKIKKVQLLKYKKDVVSDKDVINFLLNYESYIVIGSGDGAVKFYAYDFIIVRWFENVSWLITSISFDMTVMEQDEIQDQKDETDMSKNTKFKCIPFITTDVSASIKRIYDTNSSYIDYSDEYIKCEEIYRGIECCITSLAVHPKLPLIAVATNGVNSEFKKEKKKKESVIREKKFEFRPYVQLFYFPDHMKLIKEENKKREDELTKKKLDESRKKNSEDFEGVEDHKRENPYKRIFDVVPTVIEFSLDGEFLMVGTNEGNMYCLSAENLAVNIGNPLHIKANTNDSEERASANQIVFSNDKKLVAATDDVGRIAVFRFRCSGSGDNVKREWIEIGRYKFLTGMINSFCFNDIGNKIYCVNNDRHAYEFEINNNEIYDNYALPEPKGTKIENDCDINCVVMYPLSTGRDNLLIANDEYKLRLLFVSSKEGQVDNLIVKQTSLGPTYAGPIKKLRVLPGINKDKKCVAFATERKVFGMMLLPLDGNPFRMMGIIGHPNRIQDMKTSRNSNLDYIFTTGGSDYIVNVWQHNPNQLVKAVEEGGDKIEPHLTLLEGGKDGPMYEQMVNFFYYAQIKSKDNENTTKQRTLGDTIPRDSIYGLMTAMGYYPSNTELTYITNEIRYSRGENEKQVDMYNFDMFVKLYINHRPYKDLDYQKFSKAFEKIQNAIGKPDGIQREKFIEMLMNHGDRMDESLISECLQILIGDGNIKSLNDEITCEYLYTDVLGFQKDQEKEEEKEENESAKD